MRISRVYTDRQLQKGSTLQLSTEVSHYLSHVLRLHVGDSLHLFNGGDGEFAGEIVGIKKYEVSITLFDRLRVPLEPVLEINLGLGLSRGDRIDFAIQKCTELGVSRITPLTSQHGEVKLKPERIKNKLKHWRKIAINASEQSGRIDVPKICNPATIADWYNGSEAGLNLLLEPGGQDQFPDNAGNSATINLLIGPEGGFSKEELNWGRDKDFSIVGLGTRILRTETAPIAALAILQYLYGDMK